MSLLAALNLHSLAFLFFALEHEVFAPEFEVAVITLVYGLSNSLLSGISAAAARAFRPEKEKVPVRKKEVAAIPVQVSISLREVAWITAMCRLCNIGSLAWHLFA